MENTEQDTAQNNRLHDPANASNRKQSQAIASTRVQLHATENNKGDSLGTVVSEEAPNDDVYTFTIKGAEAYAGNKGAIIPERTIYDNCKYGRQRNTLKCWQSKVGDGLILIGRQSLDRYIQKTLEKKALQEKSNFQDKVWVDGKETVSGARRANDKPGEKEDKEKRVNSSEKDKEIRKLQREIWTLSVDKAGNRKFEEKFDELFAKNTRQLVHVSTYAGRLEEKVLQLGGKPDDIKRIAASVTEETPINYYNKQRNGKQNDTERDATEPSQLDNVDDQEIPDYIEENEIDGENLDHTSDEQPKSQHTEY